jgi:hypothetical protein
MNASEKYPMPSALHDVFAVVESPLLVAPASPLVVNNSGVIFVPFVREKLCLLAILSSLY